mmetsp:Transcript_14217/g.26831  ORF Transcript_14217/g.26831 Transcript_14217/m.26831 type:complete len:97 (+) Transcript_14217:2470-2760(+)
MESCSWCKELTCCPEHCCDWDTCQCQDCDQCTVRHIEATPPPVFIKSAETIAVGKHRTEDGTVLTNFYEAPPKEEYVSGNALSVVRALRKKKRTDN